MVHEGDAMLPGKGDSGIIEERGMSIHATQHVRDRFRASF
jgi:hypothetical protein